MTLRSVSILVILGGIAVAEAAEQWRLISENEIWRLSVADNMTRRSGDKVSVRYLLEHPVAYENQVTGRRFKGTIVNATIDCRHRTYALGELTTYAESGARGKPVDRVAAPDPHAKKIVTGSTFDILRKDVC